MLIALILGMSLWTIFLVLRNIPVRQTTTRLQQVVALGLVQGRLGELLEQPPARQLQIIQRASEVFETRFVLLNPAGVPILGSNNQDLPLPKLRLVVLRLGNRESMTGTFRDENNINWLYSARALEDGYILLAAAPRPQLNWPSILSDDLLQPLLRTAAVGVFLALVLSVWMSRWFSVPLHQLADAARAVASGEFRRIEVSGPSEMSEVSSAFNEMIARVEVSQQVQRDFVANVSHELKTPLTSIQGFTQALLDGTASDPDMVVQAAEIIQEEAGRMHRLVVDLLDLARLDSGVAGLRSEPVNLRALLDLVVEKFSLQAARGQISIELTAPELPEIQGDGDRIVQVFTNLVDNALKHTPPGGQVTIHAQSQGNYVEISVADTGPGIPEEEQVRIFERFYQVDKARAKGTAPGVGLGLAIAAEIIQAHKGSIGLKSSAGRGSVFVVKLPITKTIS